MTKSERVESSVASGAFTKAGSVVDGTVVNLGVQGAGSGTQVVGGGVAGGADGRRAVSQTTSQVSSDTGGGAVGVSVEVELGLAGSAGVDSARGGGAAGVCLTVGNCSETLLVVASELEIVVASQAIISDGIGGLAVDDVDGVNSGNTSVSAEVFGSNALNAFDGVGLAVIGHAVSDELVTGDQGTLGGVLKEVATETS